MHLINRPFIVSWLPHVLYIKYMKHIFKTRNTMWKGTCVCLSVYRLFHSMIFSSSVHFLVNFNFCISDDDFFCFFHFTYFSLFCMPISFSYLFSSFSFPLIPPTPFPIYTLLLSLQRERKASFGLAQSMAHKVEVGLSLPQRLSEVIQHGKQVSKRQLSTRDRSWSQC